MKTKINTNAIPDGGIDIEKLKAGIVPDVSHLETKEDASAKLQEAKDYTDTKVADLVNSAPETLDTLKEVADAIQENETVVEALNSAIGNKANSSDVYTKQEVDDKIAAIPTTTFQYAANDSKVPAERVPGVVYLVGNEKVMITFTVESESWQDDYQAEEGMTWSEFINSEYNLYGTFIKHSGYVYHTFEEKFIGDYNLNFVRADDIIENNHIYKTTTGLPAPD